MLANLNNLQQQIDKQLQPSRIQNSQEHRLFDIIFGQNSFKLKQEVPQDQSLAAIKQQKPSKFTQPQKIAANQAEELYQDLTRNIEPEIEKIEKDLEIEQRTQNEAMARIEYVRYADGPATIEQKLKEADVYNKTFTNLHYKI